MLKLSAVILLSLGLTGLQAQEAIPSSGGNATGIGGSASFSVGQAFFTTNTATNGYSIAEGVQQPYEISVVIGIEQAKGINLECVAYPNPVCDILKLKVESKQLKDLSFKLFDINGKLIDIKKVDSEEISINMSKLVPAIYFLKVIQPNKEIKTFKIIKKF